MESIQSLAMRAGINSNLKGMGEVVEFGKKQGEELCRRVLDGVIAERQKDREAGIPMKRGLLLFQKRRDIVVGEQRAKAKQVQEEVEFKESKQVYYASKKAGYVPDRETIAAQLAVLQGAGKLALQWRNDSDMPFSEKLDQERVWGTVGLDLVHEYVRQAKEVLV